MSVNGSPLFASKKAGSLDVPPRSDVRSVAIVTTVRGEKGGTFLTVRLDLFVCNATSCTSRSSSYVKSEK